MTNGNTTRKEPSSEYLAAIAEANNQQVQLASGDRPKTEDGESRSDITLIHWCIVPAWWFLLFALSMASPELTKGSSGAVSDDFGQNMFLGAVLPIFLSLGGTGDLFSGSVRSGLTSLCWGITPIVGLFYGDLLIKVSGRKILGWLVYLTAPVAYTLAYKSIVFGFATLLAPLALFLIVLGGALGVITNSVKKVAGQETDEERRHRISREIMAEERRDYERRAG